MKQRLLWSAGLALLAGTAALALRPARLLAARVTATTPGSPPVANVVLTYGLGLAPASVIVDVLDSGGNGGSATIDGTQLFIEIPLSGALASGHRVTTTATYRLLGVPLTVVREFAA
ncbi:MAG: hypothetical protein ACJ8CR_12800 [Roseiflexaceae bacterium]